MRLLREIAACSAARSQRRAQPVLRPGRSGGRATENTTDPAAYFSVGERFNVHMAQKKKRPFRINRIMR
jgi:hypothetical protein